MFEANTQNELLTRSYTNLVIKAHQHGALKTPICSNSDFLKRRKVQLQHRYLHSRLPGELDGIFVPSIDMPHDTCAWIICQYS